MTTHRTSGDLFIDDMPTAAESERVMAPDKPAARRWVLAHGGDDCLDVLGLEGAA